jgi:hypothetical protein
MTRTLILVLYFALTSIGYSQTLKREQIVGTWTVKEISFTEPIGRNGTEDSTAEKAKRGLMNSQFIFRPNGLFMVRLPTNAPTEFRELESMNNKMWHIKARERMVFVGSLDEDLMTIDVKIANGLYYFSIRDAPMVLRMERSR